MKKKQIAVIIVLLVALIFLADCTGSKETPVPPETEKKESILDRVVHIVPELVTEIPGIPRKCDQLDLDKQRINVGDAELYVEEEGKGMPVVLINGGPGDTHHGFHPWFSRLKDNARVIYYDQRGCGLSDFKPGDGYSVIQAAADLDAIRKAKKIDKWVVLGYSYGGFLAQMYTVTYPQHVSGLVLLGASPGIPGDFGPHRQHDFISQKENQRMKEVKKQLNQRHEKMNVPRKQFVQLLIYNYMLNGDWKRQHFYKPTRKEIAYSALYEWDHDNNFNSIMGSSLNGISFSGEFTASPIPTLIMEGKWDLTWGKKKAGLLKANHPNAKMVIFENGGHGIYDEDPDKFFAVLKEFVTTLSPVPDGKITAYKASLTEWHKKVASREKDGQGFFASTTGWGQRSSKKLVGEYSRSWIEKFKIYSDYLRIAFAMYDLEKYQEALYLFEQMEDFDKVKDDPFLKSGALIWQGHMLDLLGKRKEAVSRYGQAADMNIKKKWSHGQYGLTFEVSAYAQKRMKAPFKRIVNHSID